ncbi:hypothetical protein HPP92_007337 [Vanilla planifolia]|uniref:AB hydrolase-1 domain-containing protein n=1 Tax=Vanilla planifolia TaxID=51239 RepID=A0A835RFZ2_VANPL|nr:hypothetical protein HPP92_007337 [Vanilla planifolia]
MDMRPRHFVLVHGAGHGAWCWFKLRHLFEAAGHRVSCLDLAGSGIELSDPDSIHTFDDYNKPLSDFMSALPQGEKGAPDLSEFGDVCHRKFSLGSAERPTSVALCKEFQRKLLYQLSPIEDSVLASMLLRPAPSFALSTARFEAKEMTDYSKVKRVYIKTTYDNMLKLMQQEALIRRWPPDEVFVIDTDHSPFFSAPSQLFELIMKAVASAF